MYTCNFFSQMNFNIGAMIGNSLANLVSQRFFGDSCFFNFGLPMFGLYQYPGINTYNMPPLYVNTSVFENQTPQYSYNLNNSFTMPATDSFTSNAFGVSNTGFNSGFDTFTITSPAPATQTSTRTVTKTTRKTSSGKNYKVNMSNNNASIEGYNKTNGEKLAKIAWDNHSTFNKRCAAFVSNALEQAGLSNGKRGDGYQMAGILRENKNFKEIAVSSIDWKHLPAGCILCYDKGAEGYNADYGHVEISTGNGTAVSDGLTQNIRKPSAIFVPV